MARPCTRATIPPACWTVHALFNFLVLMCILVLKRIFPPACPEGRGKSGHSPLGMITVISETHSQNEGNGLGLFCVTRMWIDLEKRAGRITSAAFLETTLSDSMMGIGRVAQSLASLLSPGRLRQASACHMAASDTLTAICTAARCR